MTEYTPHVFDHEPTAQEVFDVVINHLRKQGIQSMYKKDNGFSGCTYRGPDGCMCAVGVLIPNEDYKPEMENKTIYGLISKTGVCIGLGHSLPTYFKKHILLIDELQMLHDSNANWDENGFNEMGEERAKELAENLKLVYTAPQS